MTDLTTAAVRAGALMMMIGVVGGLAIGALDLPQLLGLVVLCLAAVIGTLSILRDTTDN